MNILRNGWLLDNMAKDYSDSAKIPEVFAECVNTFYNKKETSFNPCQPD